MDPPPTQYVERDGAALAYQVIGDGPSNWVGHLEVFHHLDLCWSDPFVHRNMERLAGVGRGVIFQRRGVGLSEPVPYVPTLEQQADDVLAVMDAAGIDRALLMGMVSSVGPVAMAAACAPERVSSLVLALPFADGLPTESRTPVGWTDAEAAEFRKDLEAVLDGWGSGLLAPLWNESADSPYNRRLMGMLERSGATPAAARAHFEWGAEVDLTEVLRAVRVPTHVLRQEQDRLPEAAVRHFAELIPGAVFRTMPSIKKGAALAEGMVPVVDYVLNLMDGAEHPRSSDRALGSVLFTDIVGSTELLARLGDSGYGELRATHQRLVHLAVERAGGRLIKSLGDGTLSVFDGPARAVRCADTIRHEAAEQGLSIRAGIHFGEIQRVASDIEGMTVHIAARVSAAAGPDEILVSQTVRDVVAGSGLGFTDRGVHQLKGVPDSWRLYALTAVNDGSEVVELEPSMQTMTDRVAVATVRRAPRAMRTLARLGNATQRRRAGRI